MLLRFSRARGICVVCGERKTGATGLWLRLFCFAKLRESEAAACAFETMARLFRGPGQHAHGVVAVTQNIVAGRQAMLGAVNLHLIELLDIKLVIANYAPVVSRGIHREARRQCAIGAND